MKIVKPYIHRVQDNNHVTGISKSTPKKYVKQKTLHEMLQPILQIVRYFGILPVHGINAAHPSKLKFTLYSWRCLQSLVFVIGMFVLGFVDGLELIAKGVNFFRAGGVLFYLFTISTVLLFMKLAYYWPKLMQEWSKVEHHMILYPSRINLSRNIYTVAIIMLILATIDHTFSICATMLSIGTCISEGPTIQAYFELRFIQLFNRTSFEYWKAIICQILNIVSTFAWSFIDVFLIIISMALTELFQRITNQIKIYCTQETDESIWNTLREDFNHVTVLCRFVNKTVSDLILLSFTSNLCSICAQILHSISPMQNLSAIYFYYSMMFLLLRTLYVTLTLSEVHEASREPLEYLFLVPKKSYCQEVGRFIQQISSEIIALTGMNFFAVRKGMILSVAGTILTYELVLIQFHADDPIEVIDLPKNISNKIVLQPCSRFNSSLFKSADDLTY